MTQVITSVNPATGREAGTYEVHNEKQVKKALKRAASAFELWKQLSYKQRGTVLRRIAGRLRTQQEKLAMLAATEMGKPVKQGRDEVEKCAATLEYYANEGAKYLADEIVATDARKSYVTFQPLGVVLAIMPWNFPYWQVFRALAPTLMAGNAMVLKHASNVSGCALAMEKLVRKAGAPEGLLTTVVVPAARVADLIAADTISAVTFTGSTTAGRQVAEVAGRHLKKQVLELGGSDAYIILEDADMTKAVEIAVRGRLVNSGQSCVAAKRFIVVKKVRKKFERLFTDQMKHATFGDPLDERHRIGPLARHDLRDQLHAQVTQSVALGAVVLCGGYVPDGDGAYYPPTVLTGVKKGMPAYDEELFGPVAAIVVAKDEAHAIRLANDSPYGLGAGIISRRRGHAEKIAAKELNAGNCFVNDHVHSDARLPFGGIKASGYGREVGAYGIKEFVNIKTVYVK